MSADEYVPSLEALLDHYEELSLTVSRDPEVAKENRRIAEKSLARVRRDAWDEGEKAGYVHGQHDAHHFDPGPDYAETPNPYATETGGSDERR